MAATVTVTTTAVSQLVTKYSLAWTSHTDGTVSGVSTLLKPGSIVGVDFLPGAGGTQPTDLYDVSMNCDVHGSNIFDDGSGSASIGANLSNATGLHKVPFVGGGSVTYIRQWLHGGAYSLAITNAGSGKTGTVDIYVSSRPL